ncbi:hypothetical protein [Mesorhizobium sp. YM1C-6-2]|uniref:hypothetical protein n=1 Tax=Mesorhizobium sp. YM1C-6-2 TaxID=1827501 RepID=UPI000EF1F03F|nr:hypothetical protein [Mesorhizobium sp. YM1C-6-2]RLP27899.1 hypothetical protein D8676_01710 [Mesorhizobium sp. YM1C-6-2]
MLGAGAAALVLLAWSHTAAYRAGRTYEQAAFAAKITKENDNAGNAAEKWRTDLRRCSDAGGVFDFETGACERDGLRMVVGTP